MKLLKDQLKQLTIFIFFPLSFFLLGYQLKLILNLNIDIYFLFSELFFLLILAIGLMNVVIPKKIKRNLFFEDISLLVITCSSVGVLLSIIQTDLIPTRWLSFGKIDINDANDYFSNSTELLLKGSFYSPKGRILYPIYYASLLKFFQFNVQAIQLFFALICMGVSYLTTIIIYKNFNFLGSLIFSFLAIDFLHEHLGGNCTELIGYFFGNISFLFFLKLLNKSEISFKTYTLFFFFLLVSFLFRPGPPLLILALLAGIFYFFKNENFFNYKKVLYTLVIGFSVICINIVLKNSFSPLSPSSFNNAIDSWYATIEIGKLITEDKLHQIPNQMWNLIYQNNPILNELSGKDFSNKKISIFFKRLVSEPYSFLIGSFFLIKQFFVVPFSYWGPHHNTVSFLFIDFLYIRVFILILFSASMLFGLVKYLKYKDKESFIIFLLGISIVLSQPFLYGGESRSHATLIGFIWIIIFFGLKNIFIFFPKFTNNKGFKIKLFYMKEENLKLQNGYNNFILPFYSFIAILPIIFFIFSNDISYSEQEQKYCPEKYTKSTILFNSKSGFNLTKNINEISNVRNYGIDHFLNIFVEHISNLRLYGNSQSFSWVSEEEILKRNKFRYLVPFSLPRLHEMEAQTLQRYTKLFSFFSDGGGFIVKPINLEKSKVESILALPINSIKKGLNILQICR